jgi:uncharacterized membrane protein YheB (UPF0754 family)
MTKHIHNLDTLEKEIYRLRLKAKNTADKLNDNFEHLQDHYTSMTMNSIFNHHSCDHQEKLKEKIINFIWKNEKIHGGVNKIIDHLAAKTSEGAESLSHKIFNKRN